MTGRNLPPLPPGFELMPQMAQQSTAGGLPPLPPGFELEAPQRPSAATGAGDRSGDSFLDGVVRSIGRGTLGVGSYLDELNAATNATLAPLVDPLLPDSFEKLPGATWGERYDQALGIQRGRDRAFDEAHPVVSTVGQVAGGIGSAGAALVAAPATASRALGMGAQTLRGQLGAAGASGLGFGAVQGFGEGEGALDQRGLSALKGAGVGAGLGIAALPVGAAVGRGVNAIADRFAGSGGPLGRSSQDLLQRTLADEGLTLDQAAQRARGLGSSAMLADTSEGLRYRAEQIAQSDNSARSGVIGALRDRSGGARDRIGSAYNASLGQTPDVQKTLDDLLATRSAAAKPLYDKALERPVEYDDRLGSFLKDPIVKGGLARGVEIQRLESLADDVPFHPNDIAVTGFDEAGEPILGAVPNFKTLNVVKKGLDALVDDNRNEFGKLTQRGVAMDKVRAAFLGKLDEINPDYAAARASWAGPTQTLNAFENGRQLLGAKVHPDTLRRDFGRMSEGEQDAFRLGTRAAVDEAMGRVRNGALKGRQLLDSDFNERKILTVLGEDDGRNLINALQGEQAMAETANQAIGNSATSRRMDNPFRVQQRTAQDRAVPGVIRSAGNLNFGDAAFRGLEYAQDALGRRSASTMAQELGPVLTATGDAREDAVRRVAGVMQKRGMTRELDPKRRAIAEALTRGGALALGPSVPR